MPIHPNSLSKVALVALLIILAATILWPGAVLAWPHAQSELESPEISEPECSFYLDRDGDGEGNERFDVGPGEFIPQETPVVGGCTFRLNAPTDVTIVVESELKGWSADVELTEEPGDPQIYQVYPGDNEIQNVLGAMVVTANFRGDTPRSVKARTLPDEYDHQVQIPEEFRLMGMTAITADGRKDRLERNIRSASAAYIQVNNLLSKSDNELPEWAQALAQEWLDKGYPQVSDSVIVRANSDLGGDESTNWWKWLAIGTWVALLALLAVSVILFIRNR